MGRRSKAWPFGWWTVVLACALACGEPTDPTQVVVLIEVDDELRATSDSLQIELKGRSASGADSPAARFTIPEADWPAKLVLTPRDRDASRTYQLIVTPLDREGKGLPKIQLESGYVARETRYVQLFLSYSCRVNDAPLRPEVFRFGRTIDAALELSCDPRRAPSDSGAEPETDADTDATDGGANDSAVVDGGDDPPPTGTEPMDPVRCTPACVGIRTCVAEGAGSPVCRCPEGFRDSADGQCEREPEPVPACAQRFCQHDCVVVNGQPECRCLPGSTLNADGRSCDEPKWLPLEPIVAPPLPGQLNPPGFGVVKAALATSGAATVAWYRIEETSFVAYVARFQRGGGWSTPTRSDPAAMSSNYRPDLVVNEAGDAFAAWTRTSPEPDRTFVARCPRGYDWDSVEVSKGPNPAVSPVIAAASGGSALAVWSEQSQGEWSLWSSLTTDGLEWTAPSLVPSSAMNAVYPLLLEMNEAGRAFVVWDPPPGGATFTPVVASFRDGSGTWLASEAFESFYFELPVENWASAYRGDVAAVIGEYPMSMIDYELRATVHRQGKGWTPPHRFMTNVSRPTQADIAVSQSGSVTAVWNQGTPGAEQIGAARWDEATGWSEPVVIGEGRLPHVAAWPDGGALAVWDVPARKQIWFSRYLPSAQRWSDAEVLSTGVEVASEIEIATNERNAILVFVGTDGTAQTLWSTQFE